MMQTSCLDFGNLFLITGKVHFKPRSYCGKDGQDYQINDVACYIMKRLYDI